MPSGLTDERITANMASLNEAVKHAKLHFRHDFHKSAHNPTLSGARMPTSAPGAQLRGTQEYSDGLLWRVLLCHLQHHGAQLQQRAEGLLLT